MQGGLRKSGCGQTYVTGYLSKRYQWLRLAFVTSCEGAYGLGPKKDSSGPTGETETPRSWHAGLQEIPPEVCRLEALEVLVLAEAYYDPQRHDWVRSENQGPSNRIAVIPDGITALTNLQTLILRGTQISDLTPLQGLSQLSSLNLCNTQISDLTPLQGLLQLSSLDLGFTQISDLTPLQGLSQLSWLNLWNTQISDLTPLQGLSQLSWLNLWNTQISDLTPLQGLSQLSSLDPQ